MPHFTIVIGTRHWSSWSMRPWLALRHTGAPFDEVVLPHRTPAGKAEAVALGPTGLVPLLIDRRGDEPVKVWDSLAICEYLAESYPEAGLWPADRVARATARSISAEMHSGFRPLRIALGMDLFEHLPGVGLDEPGVGADIARIDTIFRDCRTAYGLDGPYLFGHFTIADAMYAPVISRIRTYEPKMSDIAGEYVATMLADPGFRAWEDAARREL
ncbi:glutathione S-transferase [Kaistia sp. 32K]|uniref:glutathione S-transferase family protein n=1 Tax=Kaistia sp. 32K TaxID=2795690 RepID=UPI0019156F4B|nr:glutathione S-transferase family protein [Kaistia sp. 32K]BCP54662.1 glutathione S-transferase [Kaistia sp. 32K]